jgi:hypothetical protein
MTIVEKNLEKVEELYEQKLSDEKIGKVIGCTSEVIRLWRIKNNLPPVGRKPPLYKQLSSSIVDKDVFLKYYYEGLNDAKISKLLGIHNNTIFRLRIHLGLPPVEHHKKITLTDRAEQILLGTMLGDGHLRLDADSVNASGKIEQGIKQKEWFLWKAKELEEFTNGKISYRTMVDKRTNNTYETISTLLLAHPILTKIYKQFYPKGKKVIPKEIFLKLEPLGLAVLFMDDGYKTKFGYALCTNCFELEHIQYLRDWLYYKYRIITTVFGQNITYIHADSRDIFTDLVKPYILPSMEYKLHQV